MDITKLKEKWLQPCENIDWKLILVTLLLTFASRSILGIWSGVNGIYMDEIAHFDLAQSLIEKGMAYSRGLPLSKVDFLYYLVIAPAAMLHNRILARDLIVVINSLLVALAAIPYGYLVCRFLKTKLYRSIAFLFFVILPDLCISMQVMQESLFFPLVVLIFAVYVAVEAGDRSPYFAGVIGVLLAFLCLTKDSGYLITGLLFVALFLCKNSRMRAGGRKKFFLSLMLFGGCFLLVFGGLFLAYRQVRHASGDLFPYYCFQSRTDYDAEQAAWQLQMAIDAGEVEPVEEELLEEEPIEADQSEAEAIAEILSGQSLQTGGSVESPEEAQLELLEAIPLAQMGKFQKLLHDTSEIVIEKIRYYLFSARKLIQSIFEPEAHGAYHLLSYLAIVVLAGYGFPFFMGLAVKPALQPEEKRLYYLTHFSTYICLLGTVLLSWSEVIENYPAVRTINRYLFFYTFFWQLFMLVGLERKKWKISRMPLPMAGMFLITCLGNVIPADVCHVDNLSLLYFSKHITNRGLYLVVVVAVTLAMLLLLFFMQKRRYQMLAVFCCGGIIGFSLLNNAYVYALSRTWNVTQQYVKEDAVVLSTYLQDKGLGLANQVVLLTPEPRKLACLESYLSCGELVALESDFDFYLETEKQILPVLGCNDYYMYKMGNVERELRYLISSRPLSEILEADEIAYINAVEVELPLQRFHLYHINE